MSEFLSYVVAACGAAAIIVASYRTNAVRIWKDEAQAEKARADRLFSELEQVKERLTDLENYTRTLVTLLSAVDPQRLEQLRTQRGL